MGEQDDARSQIANSVRRINETCVRARGFDGLADLFHKDIVMVHPHFCSRAAGRDVCLKSYKDACSQMKFHKLEASEQQVDIFGGAAVVSHRYDCVWDYRGKTFTDDGHEIFVFVRDAAGWKVVWRTLIPGSRHTQPCPTGESRAQEAPTSDIRQTCPHVMATLPACDLTTIDDEGFPHTTAMLNLRCAKEYPTLVELHEQSSNAFTIYMTTSMQSPKMARMKGNPKVSVYFCDPGNIIGLMLGGEIEIVSDQALKNRIWQNGWTMYYPDGPEGPEYGIIRLAPRMVKGWCRNQPFEIQIGQ